MSRVKLLKEVKEDAENLVSSIGVLLEAISSDEELPKEKNNKISKEKSKKGYGIEEVRKILADKSRAGYTDKVRELIQSYGVNKLSEVDPSDYEELVSKVEKI